jgi:glycosyltransferase involved in cell wall biosynthesis
MAHILFHRPTVWASDIECSTKLLAKLTAARGHRVTYLQVPMDPAHLLRARNGYFDVWRKGDRLDQGVRVVTPFSLVPVRDVWPLNTISASRGRYRLAIPSLRNLVGANTPDLIWTTVPGSVSELKRIFPNARIAFHVVDYYPAFRGEAVKDLERDDYQNADAIFTVSRVLKDYLSVDLGVKDERVAVLGQGVLAESYSRDLAPPRLIADLSRPRAVWSGVLSKGDPGLFETLATELARRGGSLILIGPAAPWAERLASSLPHTVRLAGPVGAAELPRWLVNCDLGVMLYDRSRPDVYRGQNPLKLYEYAAAGLPILSTPHHEYLHLSPPVRLVSCEEDITPALVDTLRDQLTLRQAALAFSRKYSWHDKVDRLLDLLPNAGRGDR